MKVIKRDGKQVDFNPEKIEDAINSAASSVGISLSSRKMIDMLDSIVNECEYIYGTDNELPIDKIEQLVIYSLMEHSKPVAEAYIIDRYEKTLRRRHRRPEGILSNEFLSSYKKEETKMTALGTFVFLRTYARFLPEQRRRELWWETVRRAVEYNCSLGPTKKEEPEKLYELIFNLRGFLSGRTFWVGNTGVTKDYPMANYNCAFQIINKYKAFGDLFYLMMIGAGVGVRVLKDDVDKLSKIRTNVELLHDVYREKKEKQEFTSLKCGDTIATIEIGDSKEGWAEAINIYFKLLTSHFYRKINVIVINYNNIRKVGTRLKTFGGTASGHESILDMFVKIHTLIAHRGIEEKSDFVRLRTIDCVDISNLIGENVVAGGVRRTAEIVLCDPDDIEVLEAKKNLYVQQGGKWIIDNNIAHRQMSNNSVFYQVKPSLEQLKKHIELVRYSGEPGWVNAEAARKRKSDFQGVNPCGEILLSDRGLCNLVTLNVYAFVFNNSLQLDKLFEAARILARAGYRMTLVTLELSEWDNVQQKDHLIGCSFTGWQDMVNATRIDKNTEASIQSSLKRVIHEEVAQYAEHLNTPVPHLMTTVKPEGTLSQLPTVSSGIHYSHSPYYIRRVRINANDALVKVCEDLNYPVYAEVGEELDTCTTKVVEFPVKAPEGRTKADVSAIEQLDNYLRVMKNYVDHNCSITIHVKEHEWEELAEKIYEEWDNIVAISLISYEDSFYELLPYEAISQEEYERRVEQLVPITPAMLRPYETSGMSDISGSDCAGGICPIR